MFYVMYLLYAPIDLGWRKILSNGFHGYSYIRDHTIDSGHLMLQRSLSVIKIRYQIDYYLLFRHIVL